MALHSRDQAQSLILCPLVLLIAQSMFVNWYRLLLLHRNLEASQQSFQYGALKVMVHLHDGH